MQLQFVNSTVVIECEKKSPFDTRRQEMIVCEPAPIPQRTARRLQKSFFFLPTINNLIILDYVSIKKSPRGSFSTSGPSFLGLVDAWKAAARRIIVHHYSENVCDISR